MERERARERERGRGREGGREGGTYGQGGLYPVHPPRQPVHRRPQVPKHQQHRAVLRDGDPRTRVRARACVREIVFVCGRVCVHACAPKYKLMYGRAWCLLVPGPPQAVT